MRRLTLLIFIFSLLVVRSMAQGSFQMGIRFNPEYTAIFNKNDREAGAELDFKSHFTYLSFGVGGLYNFNKNVGIGVDVLFSREGQGFSGNFNGSALNEAAYSSVVGKQLSLNDTAISGSYVALAELNYIKIPVMLSLTTDNTRPVFFSALVGPQLNILYDVAQEVNEEDMDYPNTDFTPKSLYHKAVISGVAAVGAGYNLGSHLVISTRLRFDYGFTDAEKKDLMVSYAEAPAVRFYSTTRKAAHPASAGLLISIDYKF